MNMQLKLALVARGIPAYKTAMEAGIYYPKLSKFISGLAQPTPEEKEKLAQVLNRSAEELFPPRNPLEAA